MRLSWRPLAVSLVALPHELKVVTTECLHTTATLNAVRAGAVAMHDTLADDAGKLSISRLKERNPEHAAAIEQGNRVSCSEVGG